MYRDESKNFFYDVTISTPDGKRSAKLTDTLMKQCVKADIVEAIASEDQSQGSSSLTLSFIEADFLPDDLNKTPTEGIAGRGYITNRTGALIDLRFDSEKGFTYVTPEELESGYTKSSRTKSGESEPVKFMFNHNNIVDITWGYVEDRVSRSGGILIPKTSRTLRFKIGTVNYATGQSGNVLTLQCFTLQNDMARVKLSEGKVFTDKEGNPQSLKETLFDLAAVFGARLEFDEVEVLSKPVDKPSNYVLERTERGGDTLVSTNDNPIYLLRNQSIDSHLKALAKDFNSTYEVFTDPITGIPVIKFTSEKIRFEKVTQTLNYRDPNGIMLEFQYNSIAGEADKTATASAVDFEGTAESKYKEVRLTDGRAETTEPTTFDPIPLVYSNNAREILERELYGVSMTVPSTSESTVKSEAFNTVNTNSFLGFITVKTIGHPDFKPDIMKIEGVGVRASTTYRFFQVQHNLSASGYTCTMQGKTQESVEQGIKNSEQLKDNEEYIRPRLTDGRLQ